MVFLSVFPQPNKRGPDGPSDSAMSAHPFFRKKRKDCLLETGQCFTRPGFLQYIVLQGLSAPMTLKTWGSSCISCPRHMKHFIPKTKAPEEDQKGSKERTEEVQPSCIGWTGSRPHWGFFLIEPHQNSCKNTHAAFIWFPHDSQLTSYTEPKGQAEYQAQLRKWNLQHLWKLLERVNNCDGFILFAH